MHRAATLVARFISIISIAMVMYHIQSLAGDETSGCHLDLTTWRSPAQIRQVYEVLEIEAVPTETSDIDFVGLRPSTVASESK